MKNAGFEQSLGVNRKITEAWAVRDYYVEYNGCEIDQADFVDFEAVFGGTKVIANFIFLDNAGFTSTLNGVGADPAEGGILKVGYTDLLGCAIDLEFYIDKITQQKDKRDQKLVSLGLVDLKSRKMAGTFISKGYPEKKYSEAIEEHLGEIGIEDIELIPSKIEQKINMVVSQGVAFFDTFIESSLEKGYRFIQDRATSYFATKDVLGFDDLINDGEVFIFDTNHLAANRIVQFSVDGFNSKALLKSAEVEMHSDDSLSVNSPDNDEGVKQTTIPKIPKESKNIRNISKGTPVDEAVISQGSKLILKPNDQTKYFNALKDAQHLRIWVPGRNINRIGVKCEVNLPRPKFYTQSSYDPVFSGEWETYFVRDKIIGWYFMQELFLRRPGK